MRRMIILFLLTASFAVHAQIKNPLKKEGFLGYFIMKQSLPLMKWSKAAPRFASLPSGNTTSTSYWEGTTYTSFSENGRIYSTHSFDVQGQLRESRTSFILKKHGILANWQIQISPQRNRPLFVYRIQ